MDTSRLRRVLTDAPDAEPRATGIAAWRLADGALACPRCLARAAARGCLAGAKADPLYPEDAPRSACAGCGAEVRP